MPFYKSNDAWFTPTEQTSNIKARIWVAASEDMEPSNESGEGDKNVDYAIRMKQFLGTPSFISGPTTKALPSGLVVIGTFS